MSLALQRAAALMGQALRELESARRDYPGRGSCPIRAVIDVSLPELRATRRHITAAALATISEATDSGGEVGR